MEGQETRGRLEKYDSEWSDGVFLGFSGMGIGILIRTKDGIVKTSYYRTAPEGMRSRQLVLDVAASYEQYVLVAANAEAVVIDASTVVPEVARPPSNCG